MSDDDSFVLYDLRIEWLPGDKPCYCGAKTGDYFELHGEHLRFPPAQTWSIYTLASLLPILPAKQRMTHQNDWMTTDALIACPDPNLLNSSGSQMVCAGSSNPSDPVRSRYDGPHE
jgi:uncharacterized repeat protein (TIGR04076 family)